MCTLGASFRQGATSASGRAALVGTGNQSACALRKDSTNISTFVASELSILAQDTGGAVKGWGADIGGVLAEGTFANDAQCPFDMCRTSPTATVGLQGAKQFDFTYSTGLALLPNGTVVA